MKLMIISAASALTIFAMNIACAASVETASAVSAVDTIKLEDLRQMIEDRNVDARKRGKHWQLFLLDDRTLQCDVTIGYLWSWFTPDEQEIKAKLASSADLCSLFHIPGADIGLLHARYLKSTGEVLLETSISDADCAESKKHSGTPQR